MLTKPTRAMASREASVFDDDRGPIEHFSWGRFIIRGKEHSSLNASDVGAGRDIRLFGEDVSPWLERTGHRLGEEMITGVFGRGVNVLVVGLGVRGGIVCPSSFREWIIDRGIEQVVFERTPQACRIYNELFRQGRRVALLAHGTS